MQWYSYSKTADIDKPRSIVHRYDDDSGGFEYEYCFAEYDTNRKLHPQAILLEHHAVRKTKTARVSPPHPATPFPPAGRRREVALSWGSGPHSNTKGFAVFFASWLLCMSDTFPSHGHRGLMLPGCARGPCYAMAVETLRLVFYREKSSSALANISP